MEEDLKVKERARIVDTRCVDCINIDTLEEQHLVIDLQCVNANRRMSTCNRLDLQTLGFQPVMPKNLSDH